MYVKSKGITLTVDIDDNPIHPRRDFDNLGVMLTWHLRYQIGDINPYKIPQDFYADKILHNEIAVKLTVFMLDHSGLRLSHRPFLCDPQGWDSGPVGVIYATKADVEKKYGDLSEDSLHNARKSLISEIEAYDDYLNGGYYYFALEDEEGELIDSCGSFSGESFKDIFEGMKDHCAPEYHSLFDKMLQKKESEQSGRGMGG